jgi:hypothetical protein
VLSFVEFIEIIFYMIYFNVKRIVKKWKIMTLILLLLRRSRGSRRREIVY